MKAIWIEILLALAIIAIPISWILRIKYGHSWLSWEYRTVESWGIDATIYTGIKVLFLVAFMIIIFIRERRKKHSSEKSFYVLPDD